MKMYEAEYEGLSCVAREIEEEGGENVVTYHGNAHARKGDYVVTGIDRAPRGYKDTSIARIVRKNDKRLTLVNEIIPPEVDTPNDDGLLDVER